MTTTKIESLTTAIITLATIVRDNAPAVIEAVSQIRTATASAQIESAK